MNNWAPGLIGHLEFGVLVHHHQMCCCCQADSLNPGLQILKPAFSSTFQLEKDGPKICHDRSGWTSSPIAVTDSNMQLPETESGKARV
jgi:hypothetical protein